MSDPPKRSIGLCDLSDVSLTLPVGNDEVIKYDAVNQYWSNQTDAGGSSVTISYVEMCTNASGSATAIGATNVQLDMSLAASLKQNASDFELTDTGGEIKYVGSGGIFEYGLEIAFVSDTPNNEVIVEIYKNGATNNGKWHLIGTDANGKFESAHMQEIMTVATNDIFSVWARDTASTSNITVNVYGLIMKRLN